MSDEPNLDGLLLLLRALEAEGRTPTVVARSAARPDGDHVVVEDITWRAWQAAAFKR